MRQQLGLATQAIHQFGVGVAQHHAHHAGAHVVICVAVDVDQPDARAAIEDDSRLVTPAQDMRRVTLDEIQMMVGIAEPLLQCRHRGRLPCCHVGIMANIVARTKCPRRRSILPAADGLERARGIEPPS